MNGTFPRDRLLRAGLLATLVALLAHAMLYWFLCDDAFISFRYARNLASGHGLVFNPGHERVEGFTNPLWVLALAAFDVAGAPPEATANVLSLFLTVVLWWVVARAALEMLPHDAPPWLALVPLAWLALTRSVAVWGTSGLETRLFEVLTLSGIFVLTREVEAESRGERSSFPWSAALLGLAVWTRPDALLIGGASLAGGAAVLLMRRRLAAREALRYGAVFGGIVGILFVARRAYYDAWLPNTYYAKVDGRTWWEMGTRYLAAFSLEYAAWLWVPLLALGTVACLRRRRAEVPVVFAAALIPHAFYVASIGGDHFEYRPLDLYFPIAFLLMAIGLAAHARRWSVTYAVLVAAGLLAIPCEAARQFPATYAAGFPGLSFDRVDASEYLQPRGSVVLGLPGVRRLAEAHRALTRELTRRFAAVRREEHVLFRASVADEALRLAALVRSGVLPQDTHIAIGSVGVIPYESGLRTLDRFGLTDADVAHRPTGTVRVMAHEKVATFEMARAKEVDLWAVDPVHLLFREDDPTLLERVAQARGGEGDAVFADAGEGWWLLARAPAGPEALAHRMPRLAFSSVDDGGASERLGEIVLAATQRTGEAPARRARALDALGREREAQEAWNAAASAGDPDARLSAARRDAGAGDDARALAILDRLVAAHPLAPGGWYLRGILEARGDHPAEAAVSLARALELDPEDDDTRYALALALMLAGRPDDARRQVDVLERRRPDLAARVRGAEAHP